MEEVNFKVVQGDTFAIRVIYKNSNGTPINLSGYSARMDIRNEPSGKILCASINEQSGITITPSTGVLDIQFNPSQTRKFTLPSAAYQLQIRSSNGTQTTILKGYISTSSAVIR